MTDLYIERIFRLKNFESIDVRVLVQSTEGAVVGVAQTGGMMQVKSALPRSMIISAFSHTSVFGGARSELPLFVARAVQETARKYGAAACFAGKFSVSCFIDNKSVTQDEALKLIENIGAVMEREVSRLEIVQKGTVLAAPQAGYVKEPDMVQYYPHHPYNIISRRGARLR